MRPEVDLLGDVSEGAFAIEAAGLFRWRRVIGRLRGVEAAALMNGGCFASPDDSLPLALQPVSPVGSTQRSTAIRRSSLENEII